MALKPEDFAPIPSDNTAMQTPTTPTTNQVSIRKKKEPQQKSGEMSTRMNKTRMLKTCGSAEAMSQRNIMKKGGKLKTGEISQRTIKKKDVKNAKKAPKKATTREKMKEGEMIKSEAFTWQVSKLLGSGGFGDVYKTVKKDNEDKREFAMKTEMVEGDKRMLRLKIEVTVLKACHEIPDPEKKKHFVEFVDRGKTDKFKFLVMGLVGPSLEDIRKSYLMKNYSKNTAMNASIQTLRAMRDLHQLGWLHRDIKPQNYAVGLAPNEDVIYMLDFGIARKIFIGESKEIKVARANVKFLGTLRFASRACHNGLEQGRKDDLETWLYMAFDLLDNDNGLPWKRAADRKLIVQHKEKFFKHLFPKAYKIVPKEFKKLIDYLNGLRYQDDPDYQWLDNALKAICKDHKLDPTKKLDWIGMLGKKAGEGDDDGETSSDNKQSGEATDSEGEKKKGAAKANMSVRKRK